MTDGVSERFWAKVDKRGPDECWPWPSSFGNYGCIWVEQRTRKAAHIALELSGQHRPTPKHHACHTCDNPPCVNPAHLWWGTASDNRRDASAKKRLKGQQSGCCQRGHKLEPLKNGRRWCPTCQNESRAKRRATLSRSERKDATK